METCTCGGQWQCEACQRRRRLEFVRELVADGRLTDYPGLPHGGADMQQPGDAVYELKRAMLRAWVRPNPWEDGREMGE